ncbi:hypothetical protein [Flavobacterium sp.]|jgi:hypothetical protein|uniref:hypothetical protein n=1 Tax=Flavobacterium sp. TaxID=239 RepID=UPI0037BF2228
MIDKLSKILNINEVLVKDTKLKIVWNCEFIELIKNSVNWKYLSSSKKINIDIVEQFSDNVDWLLLSKNPHFEWNNSLIRKFQDKIDWYNFSFYFRLKPPYSDEVCYLLEEFIEKFDWDRLCCNQNINFYSIFHYHNSEILKRYKQKFDWNILSKNNSFQWNKYLLEENKENIDWDSIVFNKSFYKNKEFITLYHNKLNWSGYYKKFQHTHTYYPANISTVNKIDIPLEVLKCHYKGWSKTLSFDPWAEKESGQSEWTNYSTNNRYISVEIMKEFDEFLCFYSIFNNKKFHWTKEKIDYCKNKDGFTKVFHNEFCKNYLLEEILRKI